VRHPLCKLDSTILSTTHLLHIEEFTAVLPHEGN